MPADLEYLDLLARADFLICCSECRVLFGFSISSLYTTGKYYFYWVLSKIKIFGSIMIALRYHFENHQKRKNCKFLIERTASRHHSPTATLSNRPTPFQSFISKMILMLLHRKSDSSLLKGISTFRRAIAHTF